MASMDRLSLPDLCQWNINGFLVVKNTFIDVEDCASPEPAKRRSRSEPRSMRVTATAHNPHDRATNEELEELVKACKTPGDALEDDALSEAALSTVAGSSAPEDSSESAETKSCDGSSTKDLKDYSDTTETEVKSCDGCSTVDFKDAEAPKTTVMLRNLPDKLTRDGLVELLNREGFKGRYDYVYLPLHFALHTTFGYAFINLINEHEADCFGAHFAGFDSWPCPSSKVVASVGWSDALQGLEEQVERYRNSRIMHESMPDALKPALFVDGERAPFPPPTKALRPPRQRPAQKGRSA